MKKARIIAGILVAIMSMTAFAACNSNSDNTSSAASSTASTVSGTESEPTSDEESKGPLDHLDTVNLGKDIVFLVNTATDIKNGYRSIEIMPNDEDKSYTYMNADVAIRNAMVEDKLGVKISEIRTTTMTNDIINANNTGLQDFQIVVPYMTDAGPLVTSNAFYDLMEYSDIINFEGSYWDQNANENLSINNKLYFTTGDFSFLSMDVTHCMVFNRDVVTELGLENPYDLVDSGKWTFDKMMELCHSITSEVNGESGLQYTDNIGLFINANYSNSLFIGAGQRFITKDASGKPVLSIFNDTAASVASKITDIFASQDSIYIEGFNSDAQADGFTNCYWAARDALANKRALITTIALSDIINLSNSYDCKFGLLVTPKFNEEQDNYYSYISVVYATACAIPTCNPDPETAALVLEALNASSTETTKKSYYERVLKAQKLDDTKSEEMLDFIFSNRVYDLGAIYNWGSVRDFLIPVCVNGTAQFASKYDSEKDTIIAAIDDTLSFLE